MRSPELEFIIVGIALSHALSSLKLCSRILTSIILLILLISHIHHHIWLLLLLLESILCRELLLLLLLSAELVVCIHICAKLILIHAWHESILHLVVQGWILLHLIVTSHIHVAVHITHTLTCKELILHLLLMLLLLLLRLQIIICAESSRLDTNRLLRYTLIQSFESIKLLTLLNIIDSSWWYQWLIEIKEWICNRTWLWLLLCLVLLLLLLLIVLIRILVLGWIVKEESLVRGLLLLLLIYMNSCLELVLLRNRSSLSGSWKVTAKEQIIQRIRSGLRFDLSLLSNWLLGLIAWYFKIADKSH